MLFFFSFFGHLKYPADALSDSIDFPLYMHVFMFKVSSLHVHDTLM